MTPVPDGDEAAMRARVADVLSSIPAVWTASSSAQRLERVRLLLAALAERDLLGGIVSPAHGGSGLSYSEFAIAVEEAGTHAQVAASLLAFASAGVGTVLSRYGSDEQRERYLFPTLRGELLSAMAFTEPEGGSDVARTTTAARRSGDGFLITGEKVWVDWAPQADWFLLFAATDETIQERELSAFLIDRRTPGIMTDSMGRKLGFREYTTGKIRLRDVFVHENSVVHAVGSGGEIAQAALEDARIFVSARLCGALAACHRELIEIGRQRPDDGYLLSVISDSAIALMCARHLSCAAAREKDAGLSSGTTAMRAKLYASEQLERLTSELVRFIGHRALDDAHPAAVLFRDAKVSSVTAGSNEVLRDAVGRRLLR